MVKYVYDYSIALPKIVPFSFDDPMSSGDAAQVTCSVSSGDQPLKFTWSFKGQDVAVLSGVSTVDGGRKASMLIIDPLGALHSGNYTCTVRNPAGVANYTSELRINGNLTHMFNLPFLVLPKLVPFSFDEPMYSGDAAQVTCLVASGDQPLEISWLFENESVSVLPGVTITKVGSKTSLLLIDPVRGLHRGNFTCTASNHAGSSNYTAALHINGTEHFFPAVTPKIVPFLFDDPMSTGEAAQVTCLVSIGDPPLEIWWSFDGQNITAMQGVSVTKLGQKASSLLIDPVQASHRGNYSCTVRNPAGVVNYTASLRINGNSLKNALLLLFLPKLSSNHTLSKFGPCSSAAKDFAFRFWGRSHFCW